jgi:dihydroorotate dehydrogenase
MDAFYEKILRPLFFRVDSERAHEWAVESMALLGRVSPLCRFLEGLTRVSPESFHPVEAFGLSFPNAVGLAAGFDKNARAWPAAAAFGFGHVEIGTVTALAQPGNPKPRMFRFPRQEAVINRLGFNNKGAEAVAASLARRARPGKRRIPLGINLGKSKVTEIDRAAEDYLASFERLADHADYVVLNVSSPNTPGLRQLQDETRLRTLLEAICGANRGRSTMPGKSRVPILLKISPDLGFPEIDAVLGAVADFALDGLIATNTTLSRPDVLAKSGEAGGLSGAPLNERSTEIIHYVSRATNGRLPIIGVGGITNVISAAQKMDAGATLVQIYTGLIYRGPFFAAVLAHGLADRQRR